MVVKAQQALYYRLCLQLGALAVQRRKAGDHPAPAVPLIYRAFANLYLRLPATFSYPSNCLLQGGVPQSCLLQLAHFIHSMWLCQS